MWQDSNDKEPELSAQMCDVSFRINCQRLRVDHAAFLARAVCTYAPIINDSPRAGIHPIHVAGSQNGWERPEDGSEYLLLSKRTRFRVRIDSQHATSLLASLSGTTLDIAGSPMQILTGQVRQLEPAPTLFSRYTYFADLDNNASESDFIDRVIEQCKLNAFMPTKILCGKAHTINTNTGDQLTRSVMLADVPPAQSIALQDNGLGDGRTLGCGLVIHHKDTGAVNI